MLGGVNGGTYQILVYGQLVHDGHDGLGGAPAGVLSCQS